MNLDISFFPVLVATIVSMMIGFAWYGPLFGKKWMKAVGITKEDLEKERKKGMAKQYLTNFVSAFITAYALAIVINSIGVTSLLGGAFIGFWMWLGFVVTVTFQTVIWEKRSKESFKINTGFNLVAFIVMGALLALWL